MPGPAATAAPWLSSPAPADETAQLPWERPTDHVLESACSAVKLNMTVKGIIQSIVLSQLQRVVQEDMVLSTIETINLYVGKRKKHNLAFRHDLRSFRFTNPS